MAVADQRRVEAAIRRGIRQGVAMSAHGERQPSSSVATRSERAGIDPLRSMLRLPSYGDGGVLVDLPLEATPSGPNADVAQSMQARTYTDPDAVIREHFPQTHGRPGLGVYYGAYMDPSGGNQHRADGVPKRLSKADKGHADGVACNAPTHHAHPSYLTFGLHHPHYRFAPSGRSETPDRFATGTSGVWHRPQIAVRTPRCGGQSERATGHRRRRERDRRYLGGCPSNCVGVSRAVGLRTGS